MNKFLKIFVAVLVTSIIILPSANASTLSREEIQLEEQKIFLDSVDNYTDYLEEEKANKNPLAEGALDEFLLLDTKEQQAFIEALKRTEELTDSLVKNEENIIEIDDVDIPVRTEENIDEITPFGIVDDRTVTASESLYVFNIKVSTIYSSTSFEHGATSATKIITGDHWHQNVNPAMLFTKEQSASQNYLTSGRAYHRGNWTVYATGSFGFINDSVRFWVSGNATSRSKQLDSTHPSIKAKSYSWKSF